MIDDETLFRQGLRTLLGLFSESHSADYEIIGEAYSVDEALLLQRTLKPDLVLLDLELNHSNGIDLLNQLQQENDLSKKLVISAHQEADWIFQAMKAGASGYVYKCFLGTQLQSAIAAVMNQQFFLSPEVVTPFFTKFQSYIKQQQNCSMVIGLTDREREVMRCLIEGDSNKEIAKKMYITVATVKAHLTAIFVKLGVKNRSQAILAVLKDGISID